MVDGVHAAAGAEIVVRLRARLPVARVPLPIYLCLGPLVQAVGAAWSSGMRRCGQRLLCESPLDMRLIGAAMPSFRRRHALARATLRLLHASLIVEAARVYLVNAFDVQVFDIVWIVVKISLMITVIGV